MHVILRADVDNLGRLGDQVKVKPGYARNYLIPQGLAMPLSTANLKQFDLERKKLETKMESIRSEARSFADKLAAAKVVIEVRVGEGDKLYGSVTTAMIGDALAAMGLTVDKRDILLETPIKALGEYTVVVKLHPEVKPEVSVSVVKPGGQAEAAAEETSPESAGEQA